MFSAEKLDDNIYYYTNVYEHPENLFLKIKDVAVWEEWSASNSDTVYGSMYGKSYPIQKDILDVIKKAINDCLSHYCSNTDKSYGWMPDFFTIQKYNTDAYMGPHTDSIDITADKSPTISIVVYLNDDYEGGEIIFTEQDVKIKPKAGSIVIFPSYPPYYHDPQPVKSGDKYMSPVFCFKEPF